MALPTAQLGQLPSMNLGSHLPVDRRQPAWHQALTAFLTNTAAKAGQGLVGNVMEQDYSQQAQANGLPGATGEKQAFLDKLMHGPQWDKTSLKEGMRDKTASAHQTAQELKYQDQLDLQRKQLEETIAARGEDRASREAIARENAAIRRGEGEQRAMQNSEAAAARRDAAMEKIREWEAGRVKNAAELKVLEAKAKMYEAGINPETIQSVAQAREQGTQNAKSQAIRDLMNKLTGQPVDNSATPPRTQGPTPTVPGGKPVSAQEMQDVMQYLRRSGPQSTPVPMPDVQSSVGPATQPNAAPSAGTSQQMGQSAQQSPEGTPDYEDAPITQEQPLVQHSGEAMGPSDLLSLVRPAQTPNSPTSIGAATSGANTQPIPMSPEAYKLAAEFARRMGVLPGAGGGPGQAGSGGLPLGYG